MDVQHVYFILSVLGDNMISGDQFVTYWRSVTGDNEERSRTLFSILDFDMDGKFGSQAERTAFFTGFDYGSKFAKSLAIFNQ